jgi:predicted ATPase
LILDACNHIVGAVAALIPEALQNVAERTLAPR